MLVKSFCVQTSCDHSVTILFIVAFLCCISVYEHLKSAEVMNIAGLYICQIFKIKHLYMDFAIFKLDFE